MGNILTGAFAIVDENLNYLKLNKILTAYAAAAAPADVVEGVRWWDNVNDILRIYDGAAQRIIGGGPAVLVYNGVDDETATGDGTVATVDLDTEVYDFGGNFTADTFTAPVDGKYPVKFNIELELVGGAHTSIEALIVTSNRPYEFVLGGGNSINAAGEVTISGSADVEMEAADTLTLTVQVSGGAKTVTIGGGSAKTSLSIGTPI